ncbi:cutinase-domain-containing protein [Pestalotiopsis sp. NC0098]|nr:cutinase-domain-containing protein [Pestalotiopsis sp. NC0098]
MQSLFFVLAAALATSVSANPLGVSGHGKIQIRQDAGSTTENEFYDGGCRDVILFFARGTDQSGNIGEMPGVDLVSQLKTALGDDVVAAQGVNYPAALLDNLLEGGTDLTYATDLGNNITAAAAECPDAQFVVSGYSQGAAIVHGAIPDLSDAVKAQIAAAVTFGDTRKEQDGGQIPDFDTSKTLIICNDGDLVCNGTLIITEAHTEYNATVPTAVSFIQSKVA